MILYKFYPPESKTFILLKSGDISFRFSQKMALNDPFELTPYIDEYPIQINQSMEKELEKIDLNDISKSLIRSFIIPDLVKDFSDETKELSQNQFGILSFSRKKDHRSMWAYYGKDHSGFMIAIDHISIEIPASKSSFFKANRFDKVEYSHKRPKNRPDIFNTFFIKDNAWKHELEYRWIAPLNCFPKEIKKDSNGLDIHTLKFPRKAVKGVYIGANASSDTIKYIKDWAYQYSPKIKLYQAVPCEDEFRFNYSRI